MKMNWMGILGVVAIILVLWVLTARKISCHESFWDGDQQVVEIKD